MKLENVLIRSVSIGIAVLLALSYLKGVIGIVGLGIATSIILSGMCYAEIREIRQEL